MAKEFIVAIELGSSKLTGMAGRKNPDGSITILAAASEDSTSYIRKGVVYNIDKTAQGLNNVVNKLKNTLKTEITQVYIGIGGQSIRSVKNCISKDLPVDAIVSQDMVNELMDANRNTIYPEYEIQDAITEEYKVDAQYQTDPVGIQAQHIDGNFLNILWRRSFYRNLNKSFDNAGIAVAEMYLSPLVTADNVLTEAEKRAGCVLVDLGAETTTVATYFRDKLRSIAVIPLGNNNITKDLESLQMEEKEAEEMKRKYASAYTEPDAIDSSMVWSIDGERTVNASKFIEVVEARMLEIIENVRNLIPTEYADKLIGGIVLTGGGSNMPNIEKAVRNVIKVEKVRVAKFVSLNINTKESKPELKHDGTMNTILSLVAKGDMNCAGREINTGLFDNETMEKIQTAGQNGNAGDISTAVDEASRKAEAERKAQEEEEKRIQKEKEEEEERRKQEEERKKNSKVHKFIGSFKKFMGTIVEPDPNE
mgnify:CR=1 FL=1